MGTRPGDHPTERDIAGTAIAPGRETAHVDVMVMTQRGGLYRRSSNSTHRCVLWERGVGPERPQCGFIDWGRGGPARLRRAGWNETYSYVSGAARV